MLIAPSAPARRRHAAPTGETDEDRPVVPDDRGEAGHRGRPFDHAGRRRRAAGPAGRPPLPWPRPGRRPARRRAAPSVRSAFVAPVRCDPYSRRSIPLRQAADDQPERDGAEQIPRSAASRTRLISGPRACPSTPPRPPRQARRRDRRRPTPARRRRRSPPRSARARSRIRDRPAPSRSARRPPSTAESTALPRSASTTTPAPASAAATASAMRVASVPMLPSASPPGRDEPRAVRRRGSPGGRPGDRGIGHLARVRDDHDPDRGRRCHRSSEAGPPWRVDDATGADDPGPSARWA